MGLEGFGVGRQMRLLAAGGRPQLQTAAARRAELLGRQVGRQRDLGVNNELLAAGQLHHEVRAQVVLRGRAVQLLLEIDVPQHPGGLDDAPQLDFAPLPPGAVGAERRFQGMG